MQHQVKHPKERYNADEVSDKVTHFLSPCFHD